MAIGPPLTSTIASTDPASSAPSALDSSDQGASGPSVTMPVLAAQRDQHGQCRRDPERQPVPAGVADARHRQSDTERGTAAAPRRR